MGKVLGGSVERNRIKRRMREAVRTSWPAVEAPVDVVFHPRKSVLELPFEQVASEVARGLQLAVPARSRGAAGSSGDEGRTEMKSAIQFALRGYKRWISPMLPNACRFVPTCSEYAMEAVERHGALRGTWLAVARLLRCHPFTRAGYDPVPQESRSIRQACNFAVVPQSLAGAAFAASANAGGHSNSRPLSDGAEK